MAFEQLMAESMKKQEKKKEKESNKENHKDKYSHHPHLFGGGKHGGASTPEHTEATFHSGFGGTTGGTSTGAAP